MAGTLAIDLGSSTTVVAFQAEGEAVPQVLALEPYSHGDPAIELDFQVELQSRADRGEITQSLVRKVVSDNPRRFYGLN